MLISGSHAVQQSLEIAQRVVTNTSKAKMVSPFCTGGFLAYPDTKPPSCTPLSQRLGFTPFFGRPRASSSTVSDLAP